ncbi:MAG TPA: quinone-dependent dihydroorotate dehydrogenase [Brevundimonas sp.]|jgi:dihydroorotate dehydrogenase|uniref:quinone-dependent dihydroorotate dehydrogenase n=1 Tax=Brevundimonas sp. TaxID=1871086 RepID=UPI002DEF932A|nr:quinone-dependent dihydroorotate dehydrogenase [Brevundimonas sp.]
MLEALAAPVLRRMDPETAHRVAIRGLALLPAPRPAAPDPMLTTRLAGLTLPNPVGLAAGLDKNAEAPGGLAGLGFGFIEAGSVTPRPQEGNPRPRLFRLTEDAAVINRMGFNNDGLEAFAARLDRRPAGVLLGANLGANKDSEDRAADYVAGLRRLAGKADWFTINVSSPNTPGLRALQGRDALDDLLGRVAEARPADGAPVFLKIAPDLEEAEIVGIVQAARAWKLDGLIVSNTTIARPAELRSAHAGETGGLSGAPLKSLARRALGVAVEAAEGRLSLIAAGGVDSGEEALHRLRQGASAVQLYSALVHRGPGLVRTILSDLKARLRAEGFTTISEAVGTAR